MKSITSLLLLFLTLMSFGQTDSYLESDTSKIYKHDFRQKLTDSDNCKFENFGVDSSLSEGATINYINTQANYSKIEITGKDLGRVVIKGSLLKSSQNGNIKVEVFRNSKHIIYKDEKTVFEPNDYTPVHYNTKLPGINKIIVSFDCMSGGGAYKIDHIKIIPLNSIGVTYYKNREEELTKLTNLDQSLDSFVLGVKASYSTLFEEISTYHGNLKLLIFGAKVKDMAETSIQALNPVKGGPFLKHYDSLINLGNPDPSLITKFTGVKSTFSSLKEVSQSVDELLTGGKIFSILNIIDAIASNSPKDLKSGNQLVEINSKFYEKVEKGQKIRLKPLKDNAKKNQLNKAKEDHKMYSEYFQLMIEYMSQDLKLNNELQKDIALAQQIQNDLEKLSWEMVRGYIDTSKYPEESKNQAIVLNMALGMEFSDNFNIDSMNADEKLNLKLQSIRSITSYQLLEKRYSDVSSRIKKHFDDMYLTTPEARIKEIDEKSRAGEYVWPSNIRDNFKNNQQEIIDKYSKSGESEGSTCLQKEISNITK